jgi:4-hydroxy-tetrahydrodipicolinate reductase
VSVRSSLEEVDDWSGVQAAVVTTRSSLEACAPTFRALLERGLAVVSTCEELAWPQLRHPQLADELDRLARERGGRLLGTGVNPGFLMDTLPSALTAVCRDVRAVRVFRIQDASTRRLPFQRKIGAGLTPEEFAARVAAGDLRHVGLGESLHFVAACAGLELDDWSEELEPVLGEDGLARGVRQVAQGTRAGAVAVRLEFVAAVGQADPQDRIEVDGEPSLELRIPGGVHGDVATAAIVGNAIAPLLASPPGLHTMASLPLVSCRHHPAQAPGSAAGRRPSR